MNAMLYECRILLRYCLTEYFSFSTTFVLSFFTTTTQFLVRKVFALTLSLHKKSEKITNRLR